MNLKKAVYTASIQNKVKRRGGGGVSPKNRSEEMILRARIAKAKRRMAAGKRHRVEMGIAVDELVIANHLLDRLQAMGYAPYGRIEA